jgi:mechanosensitive ion channel-like protein
MPTDWRDSFFLAASAALNNLLAAIPAIIGALLILAIGWILSNFLARLVSGLLSRAGEAFKPSVVGGELVKWLIRIVFLVAAANVLNLPQVSELLNQVLLWIPNLIVAAIILLVAPLIARFVRGVIEVGAGRMGFTNASLLGRIAEAAIVVFAVIVAIDQIGIAADLVDTLFIGIVAALALAFGLAFGLGGRDVAAELTRSWYESSQRTAERVAAAVQESDDTPSPSRRSPNTTEPRVKPSTGPATGS